VYRRLVFVAAIVVYVLDQSSKFLAVKFLEGHDPIHLFGSLITLTFVRNPGAAFSLGTGSTIIFTILAIGVSVLIIRTAHKLTHIGWAIGLGAVLGGATGNLTDRLLRSPAHFRGHVVDFIQFPHFAVFNLADSAIVCAAIAMTYLSMRGVDFIDEPVDELADELADEGQEQI